MSHYWKFVEQMWDNPELEKIITPSFTPQEEVELLYDELINAQNKLIETIQNELDSTRQEAIMFINTYMNVEIVNANDDSNENLWDLPRWELVASLRWEHRLLENLIDTFKFSIRNR